MMGNNRSYLGSTTVGVNELLVPADTPLLTGMDSYLLVFAPWRCQSVTSIVLSLTFLSIISCRQQPHDYLDVHNRHDDYNNHNQCRCRHHDPIIIMIIIIIIISSSISSIIIRIISISIISITISITITATTVTYPNCNVYCSGFVLASSTTLVHRSSSTHGCY